MLTRRCAVAGLLAIYLPLTVLAEDIDMAPAALGDGWVVGKPSEAGLDPAALSAFVSEIEKGVLPNVHAVLIERNGRLVFERYWPGQDESWGRSLGRVDHGLDTQHDLRSVTKSVTSALLGIALGDAVEDALARPIASFFPNREALGVGLDTVTLHHVLTMTAGLEWNEMEVPYTDNDNDEIRLYFTDDPVGLVLSREIRDTPGSRWYYNGGLTQVTAGVIEHLTGKTLDKYAEEVLFGPLGITNYTWHRVRCLEGEQFAQCRIRPSTGSGQDRLRLPAQRPVAGPPDRARHLGGGFDRSTCAGQPLGPARRLWLWLFLVSGHAPEWSQSDPGRR